MEPWYAPHVLNAVKQIEEDPARGALWDAICDVIELICDHPDSAEARREQVRTAQGVLRQVPVRCYVEDDDWVVLWRPAGEIAEIHYIGSRMFR